ncbi:MAG: hypothetical protein KBA30_07285 [Clostridia bacterium]|nr:hypothetical protein [Clostridia bacterium]
MCVDLYDNEAFECARARVVGVERPRTGIGTLGEKTLHAILKHFLEPDEALHEVRVGSHFADICRPDGILEIQTAGFSKLRAKLDAFLPTYPVTVVYPVPRVKWLQWIDETTGELTRRRKSPKTGRPSEIFRELVWIKPYLQDPRLSFLVLMIDMDEYRLLNGWSADRKRGSTRFDRVPSAVADAVRVRLPEGLDLLMPPGLPAPFRSQDFAAAAGMRLWEAQRAINVLLSAGRVRVDGKAGRFRLYVRTAETMGI